VANPKEKANRVAKREIQFPDLFGSLKLQFQGKAASIVYAIFNLENPKREILAGSGICVLILWPRDKHTDNSTVRLIINNILTDSRQISFKMVRALNHHQGL
jgi:hypothetical protein